MDNKYIYALSLICLIVGVSILPACANMGHPSGGPYDMTPPVFIGATPKHNTKNVDIRLKKITMYFDENIKIEDPNKIIFTPLQVEQPEIFANGKKVTITLLDSLRPNTTYGLFFDDAIVDNNEDNPLEDFYYSFSTGNEIDSMRISGIVIDAQTLEPVDMLTIGVHEVDSTHDLKSDSLEMKKPFVFGSKTNKMGQFKVFALAKKNYRISAINDVDQNFKLSKQGEGIAIYDKSIMPYLIDSMRVDTIRRDSISSKGDTIRMDSLVKRPFTYYYPDDITLRYYVSKDSRCGIKGSKLVDSTQILLEFVENLDTIPQINIIGYNGIKSNDFYIPSLDGNKVTYWLKDKNFVKDSITLSILHSKNDSLLNVYTAIDTIKLFTQKKNKYDTIQPSLNIDIKQTEGLYKDTPKDSLFVLFSQPLQHIDSSSFKFCKVVDSTMVDMPFRLVKHKNNELRYDIVSQLEFDTKYKLSIDSAKIRSIYSLPNKKVEKEFKILQEKELSSISLFIQNIDDTAICQLLDNQDNVIESSKVIQISQKDLANEKDLLINKDSLSKVTTDTLKTNVDSVNITAKDSIASDSIKGKLYKVVFKDINPAKYYIRLFIDSNNDGKWTTGSYPDKEPEMMYYCNKVFELKKGMTTQESWDVKDVPLKDQKPLDIRKVKPEEKKERVDKNIEYYKSLNSGSPSQTNSNNDMYNTAPGSLSL